MIIRIAFDLNTEEWTAHDVTGYYNCLDTVFGEELFYVGF